MRSFKPIIPLAAGGALTVAWLLASTSPAAATPLTCEGDGNLEQFQCGFDVDVNGVGTIAVGSGAVAQADGASAIGRGATATGVNSVAVGSATEASNLGAVAMGADAKARGERSTAVGGVATANQIGGTAIGHQAAAGVDATAIGRDTTAIFDRSVAIGVGASATRANQVMVGTGVNTYTLSGVASGASRSAQSGTVAIVTTDAQGNLATSTLNLAEIDGLSGRIDETFGVLSNVSKRVSLAEIGLTDLGGKVGEVSAQVSEVVADANVTKARVSTVEGKVTGLETQVLDVSARATALEANAVQVATRLGALDSSVATLQRDLAGVDAFGRATRNEARQGIAATAALAYAPIPSAPGKTSWAANVSTYEGVTGYGFSLAHRLATAKPFALTIGYASGGRGSNVFRAGLQGEF
jgi:hypothetical protein